MKPQRGLRRVFQLLLALATGLFAASAGHAQVITYKTVTVDGLRIFYREAGPKSAPAILLPHGFPSSSRMSQTLLPLLSDISRDHLAAARCRLAESLGHATFCPALQSCATQPCALPTVGKLSVLRSVTSC